MERSPWFSICRGCLLAQSEDFHVTPDEAMIRSFRHKDSRVFLKQEVSVEYRRAWRPESPDA
jgi:hypothetical protein